MPQLTLAATSDPRQLQWLQLVSSVPGSPQVALNLGACQLKQPKVAQQAQVATTAPESILGSRVLEGPIEARPLSYHSTFWLPWIQTASVAPGANGP